VVKELNEWRLRWAKGDMQPPQPLRLKQRVAHGSCSER